MRPRMAFIRGFVLTSAGAVAGLVFAVVVPGAENWMAVTAGAGAVCSLLGWYYATRHQRAARRLEASRSMALRNGYSTESTEA